MSTYQSVTGRRFYRNRDKAVIGGVCAGLADYFGFNLKATRVLAVIALFMAMPMTLIIYFGTVFLIPSSHEERRRPEYDPEFHKAVRSDPAQTLSDVRRRFGSLERRMARLEKYVTSPGFELDQEFRRL